MARQSNLTALGIAMQLKTFAAKALSLHVHLKARASDAVATGAVRADSVLTGASAGIAAVTNAVSADAENV